MQAAAITARNTVKLVDRAELTSQGDPVAARSWANAGSPFFMIDPAHLAVLFIVAGLTSWCATAVSIKLLRKSGTIDVPNERSSHTQPTPRGGGIGIIAGIIAALIVGLPILSSSQGTPNPLGNTITPVLAAILIVTVSLADDFRSLKPSLRFGAQILAVSLGLSAFASDVYFFQGFLPQPLDWFLAGFLWLWFVNLFNFMDGIDGIAASEAGFITAALLLIAFALGFADAPFSNPAFIALCTVLFGACVGFLFWNWPRATIFMGDVGSVSLGWLLGFVLLLCAAEGFWALSLILPAIFWGDATLTLLKRIKRREKVWQPHRSHFYQHAALAKGHAATVISLLVANFGLLVAAWVSLKAPIAALIVAVFIASITLLIWHRWSQSTKPA